MKQNGKAEATAAGSVPSWPRATAANNLIEDYRGGNFASEHPVPGILEAVLSGFRVVHLRT